MYTDAQDHTEGFIYGKEHGDMKCNINVVRHLCTVQTYMYGTNMLLLYNIYLCRHMHIHA